VTYEEWTLEKKFTFEASHQLVHHDGKCARCHGHSWVGYIVITGSELQKAGPKQGMLVDFSTLSQAVKPMVDEYLDHWHLNDTLQTDSPTSEMIARWVWEYVHNVLFGKELKFRAPFSLAVSIEETCTSRCTYTRAVDDKE